MHGNHLNGFLQLAAILLLLHCTDPVQAGDAREDWSRNLR
jgi:hypothetical protein